ncbi:MAG: hypothetical protein MH137_06180, partial [Flavobacteriales bacterium]|nr:hypothetical protein [Flavobacteriales bacterium]
YFFKGTRASLRSGKQFTTIVVHACTKRLLSKTLKNQRLLVKLYFFKGTRASLRSGKQFTTITHQLIDIAELSKTLKNQRLLVKL